MDERHENDGMEADREVVRSEDIQREEVVRENGGDEQREDRAPDAAPVENAPAPVSTPPHEQGADESRDEQASHPAVDPSPNPDDPAGDQN